MRSIPLLFDVEGKLLAPVSKSLVGNIEVVDVSVAPQQVAQGRMAAAMKSQAGPRQRWIESWREPVNVFDAICATVVPYSVPAHIRLQESTYY